MACDATTDITVQGMEFPQVRWSWGTHASYPEARRNGPGWGTQIETAVVLELLGLIADRKLDAGLVRNQLLAVSSAIVAKYDQFPDESDY